MKAVIPAAGLGTRFLPYTKAQPKEMIPVVDKPAIQYVVEEATASGMRDILIVTGRGKRAIEDHFDTNVELESRLARAGRTEALEELERLMRQVRILYVRQAEPRGLGDAIRCAQAFVDREAFAVLLGDDITIARVPCAEQLREAQARLGGSVLALQRVPAERIGRYGMVVGKEIEPGVIRVEDLVEKPRPEDVRSEWATIGRYVLSPGIFRCLEETPAGRDGEIQLTDAIRRLVGEEDVFGLHFSGKRYDVGDKAEWLRATFELARDRDDLRDVIGRLLAPRATRRPPRC